MVGITFAAALALSMARLVTGQGAETPPCAETCIVNMVQAPSLGCGAGAMDCLCPQADFFNGITSCAKESCNDGVIVVEEAAAAASNSAVAMCASATDPASAPASPTAESVSSETAPASTTERPSAEQSPQSTETEPTLSSTSAGAGPTDDAEDSSDEDDDDDESDGKGENDDDDDDEKDEAGSVGLSVGAKAGIGAAAGVVAVSLLSLIVFFIMRRRRAARPAANFPRYTISGPMPGGGRDYGSGSQPGAAKGEMSSLDFSARRYEDMLPRVQPTSNI